MMHQYHALVSADFTFQCILIAPSLLAKLFGSMLTPLDAAGAAGAGAAGVAGASTTAGASSVICKRPREGSASVCLGNVSHSK